VDYPPLTVIDVERIGAALRTGRPSRLLNRVNESCARLSAWQGEGVWHAHPTSDEMFVVLEGELTLEMPGDGTLVVGPHQPVTIPAGTVHRPRAKDRTVSLCFKHFVADTLLYQEGR